MRWILSFPITHLSPGAPRIDRTAVDSGEDVVWVDEDLGRVAKLVSAQLEDLVL